MAMTANRYVRTTANGVEDITKAAAWADLVTNFVRAKGVHTWAGGAATTDSISVAGLLATDMVFVNVMVRGASNPTSVIGVNNAAADTIDLVMDLNGENAVTKIAYLVLIA